ncbi:MAG: type II 3-dehydroquinate dehydratase [Clostridia bacterium]|nr:type II 3-dehydroquinate dehydratase [Clostridia bacterium]
MKIMVINGPNLNMLGVREPDVYGKTDYKTLCDKINEHCSQLNVQVEIFQSNHEGDLVDKIQQAYFDKFDGIVINPGAYTHTSVALLDAVKATNVKCVEVHISKIEEREDFRQISYIRRACVKTISGEGINGYLLAIDYLVNGQE